MRPSFRILLITLPLLATGCSSLFYVEAETEELCKTQRNIEFPGGLPIPGTIQQTVNFPVSEIGANVPTGTESELRLRLFELTATSGNPDLRGITEATMSLRLPGQPPQELLRYQRAANQPPTQVLTATGREILDLNEVLNQQELELTFEATGEMPLNSWTADLRVCSGLWLKTDLLDLVF
ncbi:MAG: hypothetical protein JXB05_18140 [Myxococcaceae bacterium]|nr:hypothetical protein [Myxococcaceae bacterium]